MEELKNKNLLKMFPNNLIGASYRGSIAHNMYISGTDPNSIDDIDLIGIFMAPVDHYIGIKPIKQTVESFIGKYDIVSYEFMKIINLLLKSNPNVFSLFNLKKEHYLYMDGYFKLLLENKEYFYSLNAYDSFVGYAEHQLKKMTAFKFEGYMGKKRKQLVEKFGFDCKNGAHCIRLLRMGIEFLETGKLNVYRTKDAEELLDIKNGKYSLEQVTEEANHLFERAKIAKGISDLPEEPDVELINKITKEVIYDYIGKNI